MKHDPVPEPEPGPGRYPDFLILGAMNAGSIALGRYLSRHPQICMPTAGEEPQFFSRKENFEKGEQWYRQLFSTATASQVCGEASTCYSRYPVYPMAAERMADIVPDAKLLYVLRHPVERLYSHYVHEMSRRFVGGARTLPSFQRFASEDLEARCASRYSLQISHLMRYFRSSQLLIVLSEDLRRHPETTLDEVQRFLGVGRHDLVAEQREYTNTTLETVNRTPRSIWERRVKGLRHSPVVRNLVDAMPAPFRETMRASLIGLMAGSYVGKWQSDTLKSRLSPLSAPVRWKLCREYAQEARLVGNWIGRDLNPWLW